MCREEEVYEYVKENASEYLPVIIQALTDGIREENAKLRERNSKVECGLLVLADKVNLTKIKTNMRTTLVEALKSCVFIKMDSYLDKIEKEPNK